jgi:mevalonate kinase
VTLTVEEKELLCSHFPNYIPAVGQCLSVITYLVANMLPEVVWNDELPKNQWNLLINIESRGLPVGAGLGSSAAFSVAMVGAVHSMRECLVSKVSPLWLQDVVVPNVEVLEALNKWAFAAEVLLHGAPSGLDNTTSCYGGLVRFTRKNNPEGVFEPISNVPKLEILLTNTHVPRSTRNLVEGVRLLKVKFPLIFDPIFASIEEISREFLDSVHK